MIDRKKFFDGVRFQPFDGKLLKSQVEGMNFILDEWERRKLTDLRHLAYMLATTKWETGHTMQPIVEGGGEKYLRSKKYYPWHGRGYVQLTWERNYKAFQKEVLKLFGVDIVDDPNNALNHAAAAYIMFEGMYKGTFTGKKLGDFFNKDVTDWRNARRIINGTDKMDAIAEIAKQFYADLTLAT